MRVLIGCSTALALIAFFIGWAGSQFAHEASWTDRLGMGLLAAAITFFAALVLGSRDFARHSATLRTVRKQLLTGENTTVDDFVSSRPSHDTALLLETRDAMARYFNVPPAKIRRDVQLVSDLHVDRLAPSFQFYVVNAVVAAYQTKPKPFGFSMSNLNTIDDLIVAIRKMLDGFEHEEGS